VQDILGPESRKIPVGEEDRKKKDGDEQRLDGRVAEPGAQTPVDIRINYRSLPVVPDLFG